MKESSISERLQYLIKNQGLKQVEILNKCQPYCDKYNVKIAKNDLSQYVSGKVEPKQNKLSILSLALDVNEAWLAGYNVPMKYRHNIIAMQPVPLLNEIAYGVPKETLKYCIEAGINMQADFCLKVKDDSMINARIYDGDIVFIRSQDTVENGEIALILFKNETIIKRYFYYPEQSKLVLQAENPSYESIICIGNELKNVKVLGKVLSFQSNVK